MSLAQLPCFEHICWNPDRAELRRFALAMLGGFGVLGLLAAWRGHGAGTTSLALWGVGLALAAAALAPGLGRAAYLGVYVPTGILGYGVSRVLLTAIFFLLFTPLALLLRLLGKDLLGLRRESAGWLARQPAPDRESYYRQF